MVRLLGLAGERKSVIKEDTLRMDKLAVNMLSDAIGDKPIRSISEADLKRFKALRQAAPRNLSPYSVNS